MRLATITYLASTAIRLTLAGFLIYGVYTETGKWTATFAALVLISAEIVGLAFKLGRKRRYAQEEVL